MLILSASFIWVLLKLNVSFNLSFENTDTMIAVTFTQSEPVSASENRESPVEPKEEVSQIETVQDVIDEPAKKDLVINENIKTEIKPSEPIKESPLESLAEKRNENVNEETLPDSGVILDSFYSGLSKNQQVSKDFQKFSEPNQDYIYFEVKEPDWNKIVKLVNEEIDKPRTEMRFYANGIEGKFERLMDKITYTKTFRTKYGTEITCGLVGVFVACGWK